MKLEDGHNIHFGKEKTGVETLLFDCSYYSLHVARKIFRIMCLNCPSAFE